MLERRCLDAARRLIPIILRKLLEGGCFTAAGRLLYAIIDSGASRTFVGEGTSLEGARSGRGFVSVANGQRERIAEVGDLGPLKNVQKVNSSTRTLVSVADLVEQFGVVMFDRTGAYLSSCRGKEALISKIGSYTGDRLYRFDQSSLAKHASKLPELIGRPRDATDIPRMLRSWGCADGATAG